MKNTKMKKLNKKMLPIVYIHFNSQVRLSVYMSYLRAFGFKSFFLLLCLFGLFESTTVASSYWLTRWTSDEDLQNLTALSADSEERFHRNVYYLLGYGVIAVIEGTFNIHQYFKQYMKLLYALDLIDMIKFNSGSPDFCKLIY